MSDLFPCPFCNSDKVGIAASQEMADGKYIEDGRQWSVLCGGCGASCSCYCESEQEATKLWNMRPQPTLADAILAGIVENWNNLKRDEGAFPAGDRRAAYSEHMLWHSIQTAKAWLNRPTDTGSVT